MSLRKFASLIAAEKTVVVEQHGDTYLLAAGRLARELTQVELPVALARRPNLLDEVLSGKVTAFDPSQPAAGLRRLLRDIQTPHTGRVTRLLADHDKRLYRAIVRHDRGAVAWVDTCLLDAVGVAPEDKVAMGDPRSPIRVGNTVIVQGFFIDADVDVITSALMAAGRAKATG